MRKCLCAADLIKDLNAVIMLDFGKFLFMIILVRPKILSINVSRLCIITYFGVFNFICRMSETMNDETDIVR